MDEFTAEFMKQFGPDVTRNSQKKNQTGAGRDGLAGMIDRDGGDILDDIGSFLSRGLGSGSGGGGLLGGILGSLFGRRR